MGNISPCSSQSDGLVPLTFHKQVRMEERTLRSILPPRTFSAFPLSHSTFIKFFFPQAQFTVDSCLVLYLVGNHCAVTELS